MEKGTEREQAWDCVQLLPLPPPKKNQRISLATCPGSLKEGPSFCVAVQCAFMSQVLNANDGDYIYISKICLFSSRVETEVHFGLPWV